MKILSWQRFSVAVLVLLIFVDPMKLGSISRAVESKSQNQMLDSVSVLGNHLIDQNGKTIRLLGVNKSGSEYACMQGWGMFDGEFNLQTIAAMRTWGINTVRLPLNSSCWLGRKTVNNLYTGPIYKSTVTDLVKLLASQGIIVVLDLHSLSAGNLPVNPPKKGANNFQQNMANSEALSFWTNVSINFKSQKNVIFDLFNEPYGIDWKCWRDGCILKNGKQAVGMQQLVNAIRTGGSVSPIMLEGINTATDISGWESNLPVDPLQQLIVSNHNYQGMVGNDTLEAWNGHYVKITEHFPMVTGELGQSDCKHDYVDKYMDWADANGVSYLGWTWNVTNKFWPCKGGYSLIADSMGKPSGGGEGFRTHFLNAIVTFVTQRRSNLHGISNL